MSRVHKCTRCGKRRPCAAPHQEGIWVCEDCLFDEEVFLGACRCLAYHLAHDAVVAAQEKEASS